MICSLKHRHSVYLPHPFTQPPPPPLALTNIKRNFGMGAICWYGIWCRLKNDAGYQLNDT